MAFFDRNVTYLVRGLALAVALVFGTSTARAGVVFTKIADTSTVVPGGNGGTYLSGYLSGPVISGGTVAFYGAGGGRDGIYTGSGGSVTRVADNSMAVPSSSGNFYDFSDPSISGGTVAFQAYGNTVGVTGVYTGSAAGGSLARVVDNSMSAPGAGLFSAFRTPDIVGNTVAVNAVYNQNGVSYGIPFTFQNGVATPMITQAEINGFGSVGSPQLSSNGSVAFYGYKYSNYGIYTGNGGTLTTIADRLTLMPEVNSQFAGFGNPSINGDRVVFSGYGPGNGSTVYGIFAGSGGPLTVLVDSTMAIPGGSGNFATFGENLAVSSSAMAFTATNSAQQNGLYMLTGNSLSKIAAVGDILDGKVISSLSLTSNGLDGMTVAFTASFVGGSEGIFIATVSTAPEPSGLALAGSALTMTLAAIRRSRRSA
jgi:hypothetical protein